MKKLTLYQVDAFATSVFTGNPAAVCILDAWLPNKKMQAIAEENNLSETAFVVAAEGSYEIRWFTPNTEVDLCGHATLASAFVLFHLIQSSQEEFVFQSKSGPLRVKKQAHELMMDFPALPYQRIQSTFEIEQALGVMPVEIYQSTFDLLCILEKEKDVKIATPNLNLIRQWPYRGIILSAQGSQSNVYSRCFYPACDVSEDPVTGSAHCVIAPYWCARLNKKRIQAIQGLKRQGALTCKIKNDRVLLSGTCHLYLKGEIYI